MWKTESSPGRAGVTAKQILFDAWIDDLVEFHDTALPSTIANITIADAQLKLEANKDILSITLPECD